MGELLKKTAGLALMAVLWAGWLIQPVLGGELRRSTMLVAGMPCRSSLRSIEAELRRTPGIRGMGAGFEKSQVEVDHELRVSAEEIAGLIARLGYRVEVVGSREIEPEEVRVFRRMAGYTDNSVCCRSGGCSPVAESWKELYRRLRDLFKGREPGAARTPPP